MNKIYIVLKVVVIIVLLNLSKADDIVTIEGYTVNRTDSTITIYGMNFGYSNSKIPNHVEFNNRLIEPLNYTDFNIIFKLLKSDISGNLDFYKYYSKESIEKRFKLITRHYVYLQPKNLEIIIENSIPVSNRIISVTGINLLSSIKGPFIIDYSFGIEVNALINFNEIQLVTDIINDTLLYPYLPNLESYKDILLATLEPSGAFKMVELQISKPAINNITIINNSSFIIYGNNFIKNFTVSIDNNVNLNCNSSTSNEIQCLFNYNDEDDNLLKLQFENNEEITLTRTLYQSSDSYYSSSYYNNTSKLNLILFLISFFFFIIIHK